MSTFADRLKKAMAYSDITTGELARRVDTFPPNISHMRAGRHEPGLATLALMLRAMPMVDARWLVTGVGRMKRGGL